MTWFSQLLQDRPPGEEQIHYHTLHQAVGWLGIGLPFVVWFGSLWFSDCATVQPSISHYYYTNMRELLVGVLCAYSLFLFTYKGYSRLDGIVANLAALACLGIAIFPTDVAPASGCQQEVVSMIDVPYHRAIHLTCAILFFLILAFMSLFLFTRSGHDDPKKRTPRKRWRNRVYRTCGIIILACMAILAFTMKGGEGEKSGYTVFALEVVMLVAFGYSWLTKGEFWYHKDA
jgi:hypothetical protein